MRAVESVPVDRIVQRIRLLVFFHLGADADLSFTATSKGLLASIKHSRVEPFVLKVLSEEMVDMADHPAKIEELFLDQLVKNRRG